ncbi:fructosamine kinase family protein [Zhouia sp. CL16]|nr:fructosamine kinase family protein [Zhouia amylolytica]
MYPLEKGWQKRLDIWQLYYLLVHLNLFGSSYYSSVLHILNKYA